MTDGFARAAQGLATIRPPRLVRSAFGLLATFLGRPAFFADFALLALREPLGRPEVQLPTCPCSQTRCSC